MRESGWTRNRRTTQPVEEHAGALPHATSRSDSLDHLFEVGARTLLEAAAADRAGLWLIGERGGETNKCHVVEATPGPIPDEWKHLDVSTPLLRAAIDSPEPIRVEADSAEAKPYADLLLGMRSAVWIALRTPHSILGLAMVAHAREDIAADPQKLRVRADEIALRLAHYRDHHRRQLAVEEHRSQVCLSRAILCGVSVDSIFPQIARAARHYLQARFVALGRTALEPTLAMLPLLPLVIDGWDGPDECRALLDQGPFLHIWRSAFEEGREVEIAGENLRPLRQSATGGALSNLDRLIAIPINVANRTCGVLIAGIESSDDPSDDVTALESYALLAASAMDREAARAGRAACVNSFEKSVEESGEYLLVVDRQGRVRNASGTARAFLGLKPESEGDRMAQYGQEQAPEEMPDYANDVLLEDFFAPEGRAAVSEWCERAVGRDREGVSASESAIASLEAALVGGTVVRLHLRCAAEEIGNAYGDDVGCCLVYLEDHGSRKALPEAEGRLDVEIRGLMDSIDSGVLLLDDAGNIHMVSDRFAKIMELDVRRVSGLGTIEALIDNVAGRSSHPAETAARWLDHVRHGEQASWDELELVRPSRKVVERFARPLFRADGTRLGWLEVHRDITGQRLIQAKVLQTAKMAALGQLVSGIAHELNNPLTSIQGYAQLLLSRHSASDRAADERRISEEAMRAGRIVKNLLLFSRESKSERREVDLNEVVQRTLALRDYELKIENIVVDLDLDPRLPRILADAAQLQQIVLNLEINAEQAIQQGSGQGRIGIRTRRLPGDRIGLEILDDGPGIPPEVISRIFDPFFTTKPAGAGTGLGLSIVYGIVHEHGGEISVESQPGCGATFMVEFPALTGSALHSTRQEALAHPAIVPAASVSRGSRFATGRERILVLEDEPTVAQLIADVISEEGYRVDTLLDSREALVRLETKHYDLIICDMKMPYLDGPGFYRALMLTGNSLQHRLLFVTGDTMSPRTLEFLNSSGLPYLAKPFLVDELRQAVRHALFGGNAHHDSVAGTEWPRAIVREK